MSASGGSNAVGIGGGNIDSNGSIIINGGIVTATSGSWGGDNGIKGIKFSTGTEGKAVIIASSIEDQSNKSNWSGLIFAGNEGAIYSTLYYTLTKSIKIPSDKTLEIKGGQKLIIEDDVTLTNNGK